MSYVIKLSRLFGFIEYDFTNLLKTEFIVKRL